MDIFHGVAKTTIGRGKEERLAGQILTWNIKEGESIPEKIDEGRLLTHVYEKVPETITVDESHGQKIAFNWGRFFNGITLPEARPMDVETDWLGAIKQSLEGSSDHSP